MSTVILTMTKKGHMSEIQGKILFLERQKQNRRRRKQKGGGSKKGIEKREKKWKRNKRKRRGNYPDIIKF